MNNGGIGHRFTLEELKFVMAMKWKIYHIEPNSPPVSTVNLRILIKTFSMVMKLKTTRSYLCKEYEQLLKKPLMRIL